MFNYKRDVLPVLFGERPLEQKFLAGYESWITANASYKSSSSIMSLQRFICTFSYMRKRPSLKVFEVGFTPNERLHCKYSSLTPFSGKFQISPSFSPLLSSFSLLKILQKRSN